MEPTRRRTDHLREMANHPRARQFARYVVGSGIAFGASWLTFMTLYGLDLTSPQAATVWSFVVGAPVNYALNRRYAWRVRGRASVRSELVPYVAVVVVSIVASAAGTAAVDRWLETLTLPRILDVVIVNAAFCAIVVGLFGIKYVLLDRLVFGRRGATDATADRPLPDAERVP